jgi:hypothetical protein
VKGEQPKGNRKESKHDGSDATNGGPWGTS